jgi:hypothetical protein
MIHFLPVILVLVLSLGISAKALGQSEMDAIQSLKRIEARAKVGASYDDYIKELTTTKSRVNLFMQSPKAKNELKLTEAMKRAMEYYEFGKLVWERAKKRKESDQELYQKKYNSTWNPIKKRKARKEYFEDLQEEDRLRLMGKSIYYLDKTKDSDILQSISARYLNKFIITKEEIYIDELLPIIWRQASNEVKNATAAFHKQTQAVKEADPKDQIDENNLLAEDSPVTRPKRWWRRSRREVMKPPHAPPAVGEESPEPLPASGSVMRMINPAIRDLD